MDKKSLTLFLFPSVLFVILPFINGAVFDGNMFFGLDYRYILILFSLGIGAWVGNEDFIKQVRILFAGVVFAMVLATSLVYLTEPQSGDFFEFAFRIFLNGCSTVGLVVAGVALRTHMKTTSLIA